MKEPKIVNWSNEGPTPVKGWIWGRCMNCRLRMWIRPKGEVECNCVAAGGVLASDATGEDSCTG